MLYVYVLEENYFEEGWVFHSVKSEKEFAEWVKSNGYVLDSFDEDGFSHVRHDDFLSFRFSIHSIGVDETQIS